MATLKDKLWLWGHPEGKYYKEYGNEEISRMTPLEGAMYLDCTGIFMIPAGTIVNRRQYHHSFKPMQRVGWDILRDNEGFSLKGAGANPEIVKELIDEARDFENITCAVFDDFIAGGRFKNYPVENLWKTRDLLHNNDVRPLEMWMVLYTGEFGEDAEKDKEFLPYLEPFDGVTLWTMGESKLWKFEETFKKFKEITQGKKRILGLYLYNFGDNKKADPKQVAWQLDRYYELLKAGEVDGICLHTNTMADLDHEGYKVCTDWLKIHKDDVID